MKKVMNWQHVAEPPLPAQLAKSQSYDCHSNKGKLFISNPTEKKIKRNNISNTCSNKQTTTTNMARMFKELYLYSHCRFCNNKKYSVIFLNGLLPLANTYTIAWSRHRSIRRALSCFERNFLLYGHISMSPLVSGHERFHCTKIHFLRTFCFSNY